MPGAGEDYGFAQKLENAGYILKAIEIYEQSLKNGGVPGKLKDQVRLKIYTLCSDISGRVSSTVEKETYKARGKAAFDAIEDPNKPEVQLELVMPKLKSLKAIQSKIAYSTDDAERSQLKAESKAEFDALIVVSAKTRTTVSAWLEEFNNKDEKEQKKLKDEFQAMSDLSIRSNLIYGEACVIYGLIQGPTDPNAKKWLIEMTQDYEDFIFENMDSIVVGVPANMYLGAAYLLLGDFSGKYGPVKGKDKGSALFKEARTMLAEPALRRYSEWVNSQLSTSYILQIQVSEAANEYKDAIKTVDEMLAWKDPKQVSYKGSLKWLHLQLMFMLEKKCILLERLFKSGDKEVGDALFAAVIQGKSIAEKFRTPFVSNFKQILARLPEDAAPRIADVVNIRANKLYFEVLPIIDTDPEKATPLLIQCAMAYKDVVALSLMEGKSKTNELVPVSLYKMGSIYYKLENYLLSLGALLKAVDLFPAEVYNEKDFPDIYKWTTRSARLAKNASLTLYKVNDKKDFEKEMYRKTLRLILEKFPEEGGDLEYYEAVLLKEEENYKGAIKGFMAIKESSDLYAMSRYNIADCSYREFSADTKLTDEERAGKMKDVVKQFEAVAAMTQEVLKKPEEMEQRKYDSLARQRKQAFINSLNRIADIYKELNDTNNAIAAYERIVQHNKGQFEQIRNALDKMVWIHYRAEDISSLGLTVARLEKIPEYDEWPATQRTADLLNYSNMLLKLTNDLKKKLEAELLEIEKKGDKDAAVKLEKRIRDANLRLRDGIASQLNPETKDPEKLQQVMMMTYSYDDNIDEKIKYLKMYFEWYPELPKLEGLYQEMIGKSVEEWDEALGGFLSRMTIFKEQYKEFLSALFDKTAYPKLALKDILEQRKSDLPRNYTTAKRVLQKLLKDRDQDNQFSKEAADDLEQWFEEVMKAEMYWTAKYYLAKCYNQNGDYAAAATAFGELIKYYVEFADVRIEMAISLMANGTDQSLEDAEKIFLGILQIVPTPSSANYDPLNFYKLWLEYTKTKVMRLGANPDACAVSDIWKKFRTRIYMDQAYMSKNPVRFLKLGIQAGTRKEHEIMIDAVHNYFNSEIATALKDCGDKANDAIRNETWEELVGPAK